tara:strand:- start:965 stop:1297 length:333 start_codon:yes stop_codon:yes gene_type:complete
MNFTPTDLSVLNLGQVIWLSGTVLCALTLTWLTIRLVMIGLKWAFFATLLFLVASPFIGPLPEVQIATDKMHSHLPEIHSQATDILHKLGNHTQRIAIFAYNEIAQPEDS